MAKEEGQIVLISGVNGYIAAQVAKAFLDAGFKVRGTTRSKANTNPLTEGPLKAAFEAGDFEVVEVPDITTSGSFDEAVKGVSAILHTAAPVSLSFTDPEPVMHGAIQGTSSILTSALKAGSQLKSVVFMSSIAAIRGAQPLPHTFTEEDWNNYSEGEVKRLGKEASSIHIYFASKTAAERTLWDFQKQHAPSFAVTAINPVLVTGPPLVTPRDSKNVGETVRNVWQVLAGQDIPPPLDGPGDYVDVRDVARLFVWAVEHPETANGERYIAYGDRGSGHRISEILREHYPERRNIIKDYPVGPQAGYSIDASKAIKATGQDFIKYEKSILDAAKSFEVYL